MKAARIGFMFLGIAFLMFVVVPVASAQPYFVGEWFKGTVSFKGYEIANQTTIVGKDSGKGKIYMNITLDAPNTEYDVTTCVEDMNTDGVWNRYSTSIPTSEVYGVAAEGETMIWDFFGGMIGSPIVIFPDRTADPYVLYPMMTAKISKSSISLKSFACGGYNYSLGDPPFGLGSCTMSFKTIENLKVPAGCIAP